MKFYLKVFFYDKRLNSAEPTFIHSHGWRRDTPDSTIFREKRMHKACILLLATLYLSLGLPGIHPILHELHHHAATEHHTVAHQATGSGLYPQETNHAPCPLCDYFATLQFSTTIDFLALEKNVLSFLFLFTTSPEGKKQSTLIQEGRGPPAV